MTNRTVIAIALYKSWELHVVDVDAAFLNAKLKEVLYTEVPQGLDKEIDPGEYVMLLEKAVYGMVQAPNAWKKTLSEVLEKQGMVPPRVDPCLFYVKDKNGKVEGIMSVYVDDVLLAGPEHVVQEMKEKICKLFDIKDLGPIKKLLGVEYQRANDKLGEYLKLKLDDYLQTMREEVEAVVKDLNLKKVKTYEIPALSGSVLGKHDGEPLANLEYRWGVGKLLFGMKKVWPQVCNATHKLSSHLDNPGEEQLVGKSEQSIKAAEAKGTLRDNLRG